MKTYRFSHSLEKRGEEDESPDTDSAMLASRLASATPAELNSRLHVEHVFDSQAFPVPAPLLAQPLFGPGHVDALLLTGPSAPVTGRRMGRRVSVVDQLSLKQEVQRLKEGLLADRK